MRFEVAEPVLALIDEYIVSKGKQSIYTVLEKLGVRDAQQMKFDYAWEVPTGVPIFTIWAEGVAVHPVSKRMFFVEDLRERTTLPGGGALDPQQFQRTQNRIRLMKTMLDGRDFIAVLQTNERSNEQLMRNVIAKPEDRIKDSPWHVARWDHANERAILVRGVHGWSPTDEEVEQFLRNGRIEVHETPPSDDDSENDKDVAGKLQLRFPDQEHRDVVERESMSAMMLYFRDQGLLPEDVSSQNLGYDIDVLDATGASKLHVEVKGTASGTPGFFLTRNERAAAETDPLWELAVVTSALSDLDIERFGGSEMERLFLFEPLAWRCDPKPR